MEQSRLHCLDNRLSRGGTQRASKQPEEKTRIINHQRYTSYIAELYIELMNHCVNMLQCTFAVQYMLQTY